MAKVLLATLLILAGLGDLTVAFSQTMPLLKTGQTKSYGPRDDGALQKGIDPPSPRFVARENGTVIDRLTGLVWLKEAACVQFYAEDDSYRNGREWYYALEAVNNLQDGFCGLTDGSKPGAWRLPNVRELSTLVNYSEDWKERPFINLGEAGFWTSTSYFMDTKIAYTVNVKYGMVSFCRKQADSSFRVWAVRGPVKLLPQADTD